MYYELHLTATPQPYSALPRFQTTCADLGGKAVLIKLPEGEHPQQPMFSAVIQSDDYHAVRQHVQMLANRFAAQGFTIVREKLKFLPTAPSVFRRPIQTKNPVISNGTARCAIMLKNCLPCTPTALAAMPICRATLYAIRLTNGLLPCAIRVITLSLLGVYKSC